MCPPSLSTVLEWFPSDQRVHLGPVCDKSSVSGDRPDTPELSSTFVSTLFTTESLTLGASFRRGTEWTKGTGSLRRTSSFRPSYQGWENVEGLLRSTQFQRCL